MDNVSLHGNEDLLNMKKCAISGNRTVLRSGEKAARDITTYLVDNDFAVVSGGALGIDRLAHLNTLQEGGSTIIVPAEGINNYLNNMPQFLKVYLDEGKVLIYSPFPDNAQWSAPNAFARNKTIADISDKAIVIEAKENTGGTMHFGRYCLQNNKQLFVVEYGVTTPLGNQTLIEGGATALSSTNISIN